MKIRRGFVSNSSSSSFTCDVCGNTESGMDASLSDFDMSQCEHNHTFCNDHQSKTSEDISVDVKRKSLIDYIKQKTYLGETKINEEVNRLTDMTDEDIVKEFEENQDSYEVHSCLCPICTMEEISDNDALAYLLIKNGLTIKDVLVEVKARFSGDYQAFNTFLRPPKSN
jgi:hypothetical protein